MAEFKNVFIKSKMNKDLDDRLLPQGVYRDALNIQVSKSESSDVGALENVLGNNKLINFNEITSNANVVCIGYLVSEVNSCVFFFLTDNTLATNLNGRYEPSASNFIVRSVISEGTATQNNILVQGAFLNFWEGAPIYGVNLLEDLLFFTDNRNQPRKINVQSALDDITYYTIEDTVSVAKYMPYNAPILWQIITTGMAANFQAPWSGYGVGGYQTTMQDVVSQQLPDGATNNPYYDSAYRGDPDYLESKFVRFSYRFKFEDGEYSVFAPFTQECFIPQQDGYFLFPGTTNDDNDMSAAYRSTIVDFMENKVNQLSLLVDMPTNGDPAFAATTLSNVTDYFKISEIEILFKESDGLAVLVADTISAAEIKAQGSAMLSPNNVFTYVYSGTKPFKTLPEDQLTRVYDKVPVKALGQEIISNRVVYSNFQTKHTPPSTLSYNVGTQAKASFDVTTPVTPVEWRTSIIEYPNHTLKQNRNYQAGFVLSDRFGRTTSTLLSNAAVASTGTVSKLSTIYSPYNDNTVDIGAWPGDALYVQVNETINEVPVAPTLYPGTYVGDPTLSTYNPLGFNTWKIVVKQQEQDYYNVYLPGILAAYPDSATKEINVTSHAVLLNDNINKVPRDLVEVGPDQKQFRSSVQLFGRVQNTALTINGLATPTTNLGVVNQQYYPSRFSDTVSTIQDEFGLFNVDPAAFPTNLTSSFYEAESNPLIGRISTTKKIGQVNPALPPGTYSIENLAVYETEPVESKLDIYWETSTSGKIDELNTQVIATGGQTVFGIVNFNWDLTEYWGIQTPASIPWSTTAANPSPEPSTVLADPPVQANGFLGRFRSVICNKTATTSSQAQFYFDDVANNPITNVTLHEFKVLDGTSTDVTSQFDMLQIKGTGSTPAGLGTFVNYKSTPGPVYTHDTFIIVNKSYKLYTTENNENGVNDLYVTIKVSDDSLPAPQPIRTFNLVPNYNGTQLENVSTVHVGGESTPAGVSWGQNTLPILNYVEDGGSPPAGIVVPYGTTGVLMKLYGMNGANRGNPLVSPSQNQTGLQWEIFSQQQGGVAQSIFQIDAVTGEVTEINEGDGLGLYNLVIRLSSGDGTEQDLSINITIGRATASGSFSNDLSIELFYDSAYIFNLHNNVVNAYAKIPQSQGSSDYEQRFISTYPDPRTAAIGGYPGQPTLEASYNNLSSGSYFQGPSGPQRLQLIKPGSSSGFSEGALTAGTGFINIEANLQGLAANLPNQYQTSEISWAVEYRPIGGLTTDWTAATDIEGNILSWNQDLLGTKQLNPQHSGKPLDGIGTPIGQESLAIHTATHPVATPSITTDQVYGSANSTLPNGLSDNPPANFFQINSESQQTPQTNIPENIIGKWVAVGNSAVYGIPACFGEYRIIIQNIGGECPTCQSEISSNIYSKGSRDGSPEQAGTINIGDFYYDLRPVNSSRAFAYLVDTTIYATQAEALDNNMSNAVVLYAEEGVNRYVSRFYSDTGLTQLVTNVSTPHSWSSAVTGFISYTAAELSGPDFSTPYNAGDSSVNNQNNVFAAENASFNNASPNTNQNLRTWACQMVPTTGLKNATTSVGRVGP